MDTQLFLPGSQLWHEQQARNRAEVERAHADALVERTRRARAREHELAQQQKLAKQKINSRSGQPLRENGKAVVAARQTQERIALLTKIELAKQRMGTAEDVGTVRAVVVRAHARMQCSGCRQNVQLHVGKFLVEHGLRKQATVYAPVVCLDCGHIGELVIAVQ